MKYIDLSLSKRIAAAVVAVLVISAFFVPEVNAQIPSLLNTGKRSKRTVNTPTTITAITMDFDIENNEATLLGDVVVDDPDIRIECNRMKIFMEDKKSSNSPEQPTAQSAKPGTAADKKQNGQSAAAAPQQKGAVQTSPESSKAAKDPKVSSDQPRTKDKKQGDGSSRKEDKSSDGGKQLVRIECVGDVIITRKPAEGESPDQEQRATAGKAIYYFKDSIIELLDKPVVYADNKKITGRAITVDLEQGGRMKLTLGKIEDYTETPLLDMGTK